MSYESKSKWIEGIALMSLAVFMVCSIAIYVADTKLIKEKKQPKPFREINSTSNEVHIVKLAFDTGYRACLENVLDGYILYKDDPETFENFLHAQVDMAVKPNLGLEEK